MLPIGTLRNITFLGLDIDQDVGGPPNGRQVTRFVEYFGEGGKGGVTS